MPALGGVWGHAPPGNFEKLHLLRLNLRAFLVLNLSTFIIDVPVDTGTENFLKCIICMPISMLGNVADITVI